jgi:hypothetical protein
LWAIFYGDYLEAGAFFPATGNHDYSEGRGIRLFDRYFDFLHGNRWYSVSFGPVEFFLLDSHQALHHEDVFEAQRAWLEKAVSESESHLENRRHPPPPAFGEVTVPTRIPFPL